MEILLNESLLLKDCSFSFFFFPPPMRRRRFSKVIGFMVVILEYQRMSSVMSPFLGRVWVMWSCIIGCCPYNNRIVNKSENRHANISFYGALRHNWSYGTIQNENRVFTKCVLLMCIFFTILVLVLPKLFNSSLQCMH